MNSSVEIASFIAEAIGVEDWPPPFKKRSGDREALALALDELVSSPPGKEELDKAASTLGSLALGIAAERVFESRYRGELSSDEIRLEDSRVGRSDTDYTLVNGQGRRWYRINIKFHGTLFRKSEEMVGLGPEDCFPLATYKIHSALGKQEAEHRPYLFIIVTGVQRNAAEVCHSFGQLPLEALCYGKRLFSARKRDFEEKVLNLVLYRNNSLASLEAQIGEARWFVVSARRVFSIMKDKLYERVFALRQRNFTRSYRNAEVDMHLSFSSDMISLDEFLATIREEGHFALAGKLERGTI